ncbi:helix-turn-helix domain-containing protein [Nonomuraea africana]|uniref:Transcriptional regulator with XRE-family HTH domain n=1 Tax=Nonomuraea africana TaxID=46171 RepID=A0ABR9KQY9_9ACTN|nr:helix-turn-helix transcriptional regulator [Nonomuraea africana]MBE1564443.1 transcriptional regulator with XRE-family HTH domain [Nonomuraea africana]
MATEHLTPGQRIARARHRKGWDQATLAEKIGRSVSWLSKVENGRMPLDRMSVVGHIAEVLGVEISELTGQPYRHETEELDSGHSAIPGLRLALQQATMPGGAALLGGRQPRSLDDLEANVRLAEQLRQDAKFTALGDVLPSIITDLTVITADQEADRDRAEALMLRACHMARVSSNLLGHHDLGWTAVQRELVAAQRVGAPGLVAAASWDLCGVWLHEAQLDPAKSAALSALDQIEPYVGADDMVKAMWGALHLRAAVAYSRLWNQTEAESHLAEAKHVAEALPRDGNVFQTQFNRVNTTIHAVEVSMELGRPRDVITRAEHVAIAEIASSERQAHYWTCTAAGYHMNRKENEAVDALLRADRIAPQHVRNRPLVRNIVRDLRGSGPLLRQRELLNLAKVMRLP